VRAFHANRDALPQGREQRGFSVDRRRSFAKCLQNAPGGSRRTIAFALDFFEPRNDEIERSRKIIHRGAILNCLRRAAIFLIGKNR